MRDSYQHTISPRRKGKKAADTTLTRLALNTAISLPEPSLPSLLNLESTSFDLALKEVECARQFNFELPEDLTFAVELIESSVQTLTGTAKNVILVLNEEDGTYRCLNDEKIPGSKPRELTRISDHFLQDLLDTDEVLYTFLYAHDALIGIIAVGEKADGRHFSVQDEIILELVSRYLSTKVLAFQSLKESLSLPYIQNAVLQASSRLVTAVDSETILKVILESFGAQLGCQVCQYVVLDPQTGEGQVLFENQNGVVHSYTHIGHKAKRKSIQDFASFVSLFSSVARKNRFLHIPGKMLGDKPLSDMFGVSVAESALILPIIDTSTGKIQGTFNLFFQQSGVLSDTTLEIAKEVTALVCLALSRAKVLEKALAMASSDELTGLTNRRGFYERFESEIERARRNPTSLCVVMIDVDHFKPLNDAYGHLNGDLALQHLAQLLSSNVRKSDVVCRFGGEEFALLLPDTTLQSATDLLERIRRKIQKYPIEGTRGETLKVTVSAGVAQVNTTFELSRPSQDIISESLAMADEQLYLAKETGRNKVCSHC